ncbi:hypothetical protein NM208_g4110 [Fusarium decemcellulare]|uniref:Uncharacterized protein n=1 Tax=Fusarium decemcellulare TaxID=57161 RepID=A0ACC1SLQ7_9HYPO|nr:hypothetical protein NM208_g4110 [Fusarium decemcellulare]
MEDNPLTHGKQRRACDACRKRKLKCSRDNPCERCMRLRISCEYSFSKRMGRPRRPKNAASSSTSDTWLGSTPSDTGFTTTFGDFSSQLDLISPSFALPTPGDGFWAELVQIADSGILGLDNFSPETSQDTSCPASSEARDSVNCTPCHPAVSSRGCECAQLVQDHFAAWNGTIEGLHSINMLRRSAQLAEVVLNCNACFRIDWKPSDTVENFYLIASLMSTAASSYIDFLSRQHQELQSRRGRPTKLFLGESTEQDSLVEISLGGAEYWGLLKRTLGAELDRLSSLCQSFATRQGILHHHGHEKCLRGVPCGNNVTSRGIIHHADTCPKGVNPSKYFICLVTISQIQADIEQAQKKLEQGVQ